MRERRPHRNPGRAALPALSGLLGLTLVTGLGGCAATKPSQRQPALSVEVVQFRSDYADRVVALSVRNDGDTAIEILRAEYSSAYLSEPLRYPPEGRVGATVPAHATRDLRVALPEVRCGQPDGLEANVVIETRSAAGGSNEYSAVPDDPLGTIARIVAQECQAAAVEAVVTIRPPTALRVEGTGSASRAWLDVAFEPSGVGPGSVTLLALHPTTLLDSPGGNGWPLDLTIAATGPSVRRSVEIRPARCDPHAVAEDKRGTVLSFEPAEGGRYEVPVRDSVRAEIYDVVAAVCEFPAPSLE